MLCVFSTHSPKKLPHGGVSRLSEHLANKSLHRRHGLTAPHIGFRHVPNGAGGETGLDVNRGKPDVKCQFATQTCHNGGWAGVLFIST